MPFQPINVLNTPLLKSPWEQDFAKILQQGIQLRHEPQRLLRQKEQEELMNALRKEQVGQAQAETPFAGRRAEADAKAKETLARFGGVLPSGETGERYSAWNLNESGHPVGPAALKSLDLRDKTREETLRLKPLQAASATGKHAIERAEANKRLQNPNLNPTEKREAQRDLRAVQLKEWQETADADSLKKYRAGEQIQKTLGMIDIDAIAKGAGITGKKWLAQEAIKSAFGKESPEYTKHELSLKGLEALAEQVGTFYGTASASEAQNRLRAMIHNPRLLSNKNLAKAELNYIKKLLHQEHKTFEDSLLYKLEDFQKVDSATPSMRSGDEALKAKNAKLIKQQQAMAEALRKTQPKMASDQNSNAPPKVTRRWVNGKWTQVEGK